MRLLKALLKRIPKGERAFFLAILAFLWGLWAIGGFFFGKNSSELESHDSFSQNQPSERGSGFANPDCVRVCSWNVRNYSVANRRVGEEWREFPKPESEKFQLRKSLRTINADIVLLQEMGDPAFLEELRSDLRSEGIDYPFAAITSRDSSMRLAMLSRLRPEKILDAHSISFNFKGDRRFSPRGTLGAQFRTNGVKWCVFTVHLKSKQGGRKSDKNFFPFRCSEASAISSKIVDFAGNSNMIMLCGDFNDEPSSGLYLRFSNRILTFALLPFVDGDKAWTYYWAKKDAHYVYDYFLLSNSLMKIASPAMLAPFSVASDHRPIYTDLDFSKIKEN